MFCKYTYTYTCTCAYNIHVNTDVHVHAHTHTSMWKQYTMLHNTHSNCDYTHMIITRTRARVHACRL